MVDIENPDRPRGILSRSDRKYLADPEGYKSRQSRHKRKQAIPERIRHAFLDMSILADPEFPEDLFVEAFQDEGQTVIMGEVVGAWRDREPAVTERPTISEGMMQAFVDAVALIANVNHFTAYRGIVEEGTKTAVERFGEEYVVVDVSYDPEIEQPTDARKRAKWRLEKGHTLTDEEAVLLLEDEDVDPDAVAENIRGRDNTSDTEPERTLAQSLKDPRNWGMPDPDAVDSDE